MLERKTKNTILYKKIILKPAFKVLPLCVYGFGAGFNPFLWGRDIMLVYTVVNKIKKITEYGGWLLIKR